MTSLSVLLVLTAAYLVGSVSFAVLVSRMFGLADPRAYGSGNPGATNVLRSGNRTAALLTLLGDAAKGAVAVLAVRFLGAPFGLGELAVAAAGVAAFAGHVYPAFFRFKGGKGVATFLGVLLALDPLVGLGCCGLWLLVALVTRYSSLASMTAAVAAPLAWLLTGREAQVVILLVGMSALLLWRHRSNIENLLAGRERRIGRDGQRGTEPPSRTG